MNARLGRHRFGFYPSRFLSYNNDLDDAGRNGGHLTPAVFVDFCGYVSKYGTEQAVRSFELENHTASEIVKLISDEGWTDAVDLVENGHTTLLFTSSELAGVEADFNAAKAAGMNLAEVNWLSKEEAHRVSRSYFERNLVINWHAQKYGADYPAVEFGGFNLWPLKFVTHLYRLAKSKGHKHSLELNIHTRTPATSISRLSSSTSSSRRWAITTPRGVLTCSHIIHAANAYASHLLPSFAGPAGIIPTRGQVVALRATVPASELGSKCSWDANEGFEYWFPRPTSAEGEEKPLVILGGGREVEVPDYGYNETDDSVVHRGAGVALRKFLPAAFPGKFAEGGEPEMEWVWSCAFLIRSCTNYFRRLGSWGSPNPETPSFVLVFEYQRLAHHTYRSDP
jgi:glycine/D-amino acid oxidase-like deaminating enzyme